MFGPLGVPELIFIFALALLIFGPRKLPEIGRTIGRGLSEFRKASTELKRSINAEMIEEELRQSDPRRMMDPPADSKSSNPEGSDADKATADKATADEAKADEVIAEEVTASEPSAAAPPAGSIPRSSSGAPSSDGNSAETSADSEAS